MPYADSEKQQQYYRERQERRKTDAEYIAKRNASFKKRYEDPEFRVRNQEYQREYKRERRKTDPTYGLNKDATNANRRFRGIIWTPEQEAEFNALTACEVCTGEKKLHMDHCHDCHHYRGGLCSTCNHQEGVLRKWQAVCPEGSPMKVYLDRHVCVQ